jgi:hypothetical protein
MSSLAEDTGIEELNGRGARSRGLGDEQRPRIARSEHEHDR